MQDPDDVADAPLPATAIAIVSCALIFVLAIWLVAIPADHLWRPGTILLLKTFAALLLTFTAGARLGLATSAPASGGRTITLSAVPVLVAWVAILLPEPWSFALLAAAFAALGAWDSFAVHRSEAPAWFGRLRIRQTLAIVLALFIAIIATAV